MMRRKFSLANIPLLNIGPARLDNKSLREQLLSPTESRPPTPRSVRPPLPLDIDAQLRAACTYVVNHPKPSHEVWTTDAPKPALDYAAVKYDAEYAAPGPARKPSTRSRSAAPRQDTAGESSKYGYRPNVPTDELFRGDNHERAPTNIHARSRADQLMAPEPVKVVTVGPRSQHDQQQLAPAGRSDAMDKKRRSTRSNSVGTTGSTPHTDTTDYPWSASTPMTSAAITPARDSKRTSSQNVTGSSEGGSVPKVEPVNAEWMLAELEKHKKAMEERERERERADRQIVESTPTQPAYQAPIYSSRVPPRKPVPSRPGSRQANEAPVAESRPGRQRTNRDYPPLSYRGRSESSRPTDRSNSDADGEERGRGTMRSSSRLGRAASRAASRAGSITEAIGNYVKPGSSSGSQRQGSLAGTQRSSSRARSISNHIKEYIRPSRPGTAMDSRKPSMDTGCGHFRNGSTDSLHSSVSKATSAGGRSRWQNWHPLRKGRSQATTPDMSRPGSSGSAMKTQRESPPKTRPIDLNRELPPLPGLDQWKAEEEEPQQPQSIPRTNTMAAQQSGLRRVLSRRHKHDKQMFEQASQNASREGIVAARLGSPTPPLSQKQSVDAQLFEPGYPSPPVSLSPDIQSPNLGLQQLSQSRSRDPLPIAAQRSGQRLRSESNQSNYPELTIERTASPSGLSANLHLFPVPRSATASPVTGKRRADMRNEYTSSSASVNTAPSHTRTNSDRLNALRKQSTDEYKRYQASLAVSQQQPPPVDKEESRRKWWQSKDKKQHANWMNQVSQSGARNGMLLADEEAAGSPVVRF